MHTPQAAAEIAAAAVDLLGRVLDTFDQREAADVVRSAAPLVRESAAALASAPISSTALTESIAATLGSALVAAGLGSAAAWPGMLAPALQAWIIHATQRPLAGAVIEGVADLS